MTYKQLQKLGTKIREDDFYDGMVYLYSVSYWMYDGKLYRHNEHPNSFRYTGKTETFQCDFGDVEHLLFTDEEKAKCSELGLFAKKDEYDVSEIKQLRQDMGLTQVQFSELLGIPLDDVRSWDCGRRAPVKWAGRLVVKELKEIKALKEAQNRKMQA